MNTTLKTTVPHIFTLAIYDNTNDTPILIDPDELPTAKVIDKSNNVLPITIIVERQSTGVYSFEFQAPSIIGKYTLRITTIIAGSTLITDRILNVVNNTI